LSIIPNFGIVITDEAMKGKLIVVLFLALAVTGVTGQQVPDTVYAPPVENPAYARGQGPLVYIDEGHNNFHTRGDRYLPFASCWNVTGMSLQVIPENLRQTG